MTRIKEQNREARRVVRELRQQMRQLARTHVAEKDRVVFDARIGVMVEKLNELEKVFP